MPSRIVRVVDYDPSWPRNYAVEADLLRAALGDVCVSIEHIGSTAIPGMAAKPTIDIMVGINCLDEQQLPWLAAQLTPLGYRYDPAALADEPSRWVYRKGPSDEADMRTHHLHVTAFDGAYWRRILAFRDYLRTHQVDATAYVTLKRSLARQFSSDSRNYTKHKHQFVVEIEAQATACNVANSD